MSEGRCSTRRVSKLFTPTLQVVRSTPFTDARQSASDRDEYCELLELFSSRISVDQDLSVIVACPDCFSRERDTAT